MIQQKLSILSLLAVIIAFLPSRGIVQSGSVNRAVPVPSTTTLTWNQFHNVSSSCSDWTPLTSNNFTAAISNGVFSINGTKQQGIYWAEIAGFETTEQFGTSSPISLEMTGSVSGTGSGWGLQLVLADSQHAIDLGAYDDEPAGRKFAYVLPHVGRYRYPTDFQPCGDYTSIADIDVSQPHTYRLTYSERIDGATTIASVTASVDSNAPVTMDLPWRLNNPNAILLGTARAVGDTIHATVTNFSVNTNPSGCVSDDFSTSSLASAWTKVDPRGNSSFSLTANPGQLHISTPDGNHDLNTASNVNAPRLLQSINGNFDISTKVTVHPAYDYQSAGLLFWLDNANFVWTGRGSDNQVAGVYTRAGQMNNPPQIQNITATTIYLRLTRNNNTITTFYSLDGTTWKQTGTIDYPGAASTASVGMYLINQWQDNPISADFDYFRCGASTPNTIGSKVFLPIVSIAPPFVTAQNPNYAGYAVTGSPTSQGVYKDVTATWKVPELVSCEPGEITRYGTWVGFLDSVGHDVSDLVQAGTTGICDATPILSKKSYVAFWQVYKGGKTEGAQIINTLTFPVFPGNQVKVEVKSYCCGEFGIDIWNISLSSFHWGTVVSGDNAAKATAVATCIQEDPENSLLAHFSSVAITCTVDNHPIGSAGATIYKFVMDQAKTGPLNNSGKGDTFTVDWVHK